MFLDLTQHPVGIDKDSNDFRQRGCYAGPMQRCERRCFEPVRQLLLVIVTCVVIPAALQSKIQHLLLGDLVYRDRLCLRPMDLKNAIYVYVSTKSTNASTNILSLSGSYAYAVVVALV